MNITEKTLKNIENNLISYLEYFCGVLEDNLVTQDEQEELNEEVIVQIREFNMFRLLQEEVAKN